MGWQHPRVAGVLAARTVQLRQRRPLGPSGDEPDPTARSAVAAVAGSCGVDGMSGITVPRVVALWGVGNGVLVVVLVGYGENGFAIALYGAVVALLEVVALAAWLSAVRLGERGARSPVGRR